MCGKTANESLIFSGEVFDYLVAHGRMKEKEARAKFRQVSFIFQIQIFWSNVSHEVDLTRFCEYKFSHSNETGPGDALDYL